MDEFAEQQPPDNIVDIVQPVYQSIWETVNECWEIWHTCHSPAKQSLKHYRPLNRAIGSDMSDMLKALFKERIEDGSLPNLDFIESDKLWFIVLSRKVAVRFNLMNKDGMTAHTPSSQFEMYLSGQITIKGFEKLECLYGGYVLDDTKSAIINLYILKRDTDERPLWVIDNRYGIFTQTMIPYENPARIVEPKDQQRRRATAKKKPSLNNMSNQAKTGTDDA